MIRLRYSFRDDALAQLRDGARQSPMLMKNAARVALNPIRTRALAKLKRRPRRVKYPIAWTTPKQKRAFFATKGFGRGIPTQRTGALSKGWYSRFRYSARDVSLEFGNPLPYATYVQGERQQRFHRNTGYTQAQPVFEDVQQQAVAAIREAWLTVTRPNAGVRR